MLHSVVSVSPKVCANWVGNINGAFLSEASTYVTITCTSPWFSRAGPRSRSSQN